jgi:hypothetical protein
MPIQLKPTTPAGPPRIAETPEFKELQGQIEEATRLLASISNQIVAIEATMKSTPTPAPGPAPGPSPMPGMTPPNPAVGESFEESIAEMRRIAGIK